MTSIHVTVGRGWIIQEGIPFAWRLSDITAPWAFSKCLSTCRILLQYGMWEGECYQIPHLSVVIIHCDETAKYAGLSSFFFTLDHTQAQREKSIMYSAAHCQWNKAFGFSPFISDSGRLSLSASVHAAADAVTLCNSVHLFTLCSPLPALSLSHPNFK